MARNECASAEGAVLEVLGGVEAPVHPPRIRARPGLAGGDSPLAPKTLAPPREDFPLHVRPAHGSCVTDPKKWAAAARPILDDRLAAAGAILLRGLPLATVAEFSEFFVALGYEPVPYHGFATREEIAPGVTTPNIPNPRKAIMLHNDMSTDPVMPAHVFLFCAEPPPEDAGGETPIARCSDWTAALGPELWARFAERGLSRWTTSPDRERGSRPGMPWQQRYQTEDPDLAAAKCRAQGDEVIWEADGSLTTRRLLDPFREHCGELLWSSTPQSAPPVSSVDFRYADGERIEPEIIERITVAQWKIAVAFTWRAGDVLCLDNLGCQHGRLPYTPGAAREIFVAIATPTPGNVRTPAAMIHA
jgi:hypothetical protein